MRQFRTLSLLGALSLSAFLGLGCVDQPGGGSTGGTVLYAYDNNTQQITNWDANDFNDNPVPTTTKTVSSGVFQNKMANLAWGGLVLDSVGNHLYLVHETTGDIIRVNNIRNQSGTISSTSPDVATFTLGLSSSDRLSNGTFSQASFDSSSNTLYVTEKNDSQTRIWMIGNASSLQDGSTVQVANVISPVSGDLACTGVAAGLGQVFAYFDSGSGVGPDAITGPRLRKGSSSGFSSFSSALVGSSTGLGKYGSLALDSGNNVLFVARHNTDSSGAGNPVMAFGTGLFSGAFNQAPDFTLGTPDQANLRVLAHPGNKEWLAAVTSSGATASNQIYLWKLPRSTPAPVAVIRTVATATSIKGIAFDGNN